MYCEKASTLHRKKQKKGPSSANSAPFIHIFVYNHALALGLHPTITIGPSISLKVSSGCSRINDPPEPHPITLSPFNGEGRCGRCWQGRPLHHPCRGTYPCTLSAHP